MKLSINKEWQGNLSARSGTVRDCNGMNGGEAHGFHYIRHTVASEIVWAGGTNEKGMAMTGHSTPKMFAHYLSEARQRTRVKRAQKVRGQNKNGT